MNIELWKVMSFEPEKCITTLKKGTGSGINSGKIKGDFLATKDGWMGLVTVLLIILSPLK